MDHASRIALNTWTLDSTSLAAFLDVAKATGYRAIELRMADFHKVDDWDAAAGLVRDSGLAVASLGAEASMVRPTLEAQDEWLRSLERSAALAQAIGCGTIMVSTGSDNATEIAPAAEILEQAGDIVAGSGLCLAFEFNAFHPTIGNLETALRLLATADRDNVSLALDSYHLHQSGGMKSLALVPPELVSCVQLSDVPISRSEAMPPLDRQIPGTGGVDWRRLFTFLGEIDYRGFVSFEAPNPRHWRGDAKALAAAGLSGIVKLWDRKAAD